MFFTDIRDRKIYYEIHGSGTPIILLHHGFGSSKMWKDIFRPLVEAGYQIIMYDRPGYGRSAGADNFNDDCVSDLFRAKSVRELDQLINFLKLDSFHLIGQCEGGVVAIDYAAQFTDRVKTVVTSNTLCWSKVTMTDFNNDKFPSLFQGLDSEMQQKLIDWHGADYAESFYNSGRSHGGAYGRDRFDLRPALAQVICPALVLYADRSSLFEVEQGVEFYHHLPAGELSVMAKCGHNTYEQQPGEYVHQILKFLDRHQN